MDEKELIMKIQSGDMNAFAIIFEKADYETNCEAISKYIKKEQADILHEIIDELDIKQKMVIILYYFNELTAFSSSRFFSDCPLQGVLLTRRA